MDNPRDADPNRALTELPATFAATVSSLHTVAESLVAPARKPDNEIALQATPGGFGTPEFEFEGTRHQVRVEDAALVHTAGDRERRAPLTSLREAAAAVSDLLPDGAELSDEPLDVDPESARVLGAWYAFGTDVLGALVSEAGGDDRATPPTLWPEHFDIAIELGAEKGGGRANYGLSPGDEEHAEPYLYVGPWAPDISGDLWNATGFKGAELGYADLLAAADQRAAAMDFLRVRRDALAEIATSAE